VLGGAAPVRSGCCGRGGQGDAGSYPVDCRSYTKPQAWSARDPATDIANKSTPGIAATVLSRRQKHPLWAGLVPSLAERTSPDELRTTFQGLLNPALTRGRASPTWSRPWPRTVAAIDLVAYEHPNAEADCIAAAYDAFEHEYGDG
jgi:hypothetical protein